MEPDLKDWVRKFASLGDLFSAMPQLYANLRAQNIQGIVEDGAVIIGAVHIGMGSVVHGQAIVRGPAIVGNNAVVDSHTEIRPGSGFRWSPPSRQPTSESESPRWRQP